MKNFRKILTVATSVTVLIAASVDVHARDSYETKDNRAMTRSLYSPNNPATQDSLFNGADKSAPFNRSMTEDELFNAIKKPSSSAMQAAAEQADPKPLRALTPVVQKVGDRFIVDQTFVKNARTYADMADFSYHLVKGRNEIVTKYMEDFMKKGWKITAFSGFSGNDKFDHDNYDAKNTDVAGFVAFNAATGEAVVTFHGSQDGLDWENNFQGDKVDARAMGFNFDGKIQHGFADRYNSSKKDIYTLLTRIYEGLDAEGRDKFHITTTGHSLGGGMTTVGFADLATGWAKQTWGTQYKNALSNRIRGYALSAPRAFDAAAVDGMADEVGTHNIIIDTNDADPVSMIGPGKTATKWFEDAYAFGPTRMLLQALKFAGIIDVSNPQLVAEKYGDYKHLGIKALQSTSRTHAIAETLANGPDTSGKGFFGRTLASIKNRFAPTHYGNLQSYGIGFDSRLVETETLEARINGDVLPEIKVPAKKSFWSKIFG